MNAVHLAERATLGCLLLEPTLMDSVSSWLRAEDFNHPWHRSVFATIRELHVARAPLDPASVGQAVVRRLGHRKADLPRVVDLLQAAPIHPHGQRYASMVLEASLRREVACQGVLLQEAALSASLSQRSSPVTRITALVDATLTQAEGRWLTATGGRAEPGPRAGWESRNREHDTALGADRLLRAHPPLDLAEVCLHEERLVASLISHPSQIVATATWLRPDAVSHPEWRPVYTAIVQMAELGQPIDVVTVAWEVHRTSARLGPGPGTRTLREAADLSVTDDPRSLGRVVACDHLRVTADHAADALRTAASSPGLELVDVLHTGRLLAAAVRETAGAISASHTDGRAGRRLAAVRDPAMPRAAETSVGVLGPVAG